MRHTRAGRFVDLRHRSVARPAQSVQAGQLRQPDRKIDILALMQQLDPEAPKRLEARNLARKWSGDASEQRHTLHRGERHEARGHGVGGGPERLMMEQKKAILLGDLTR